MRGEHARKGLSGACQSVTLFLAQESSRLFSFIGGGTGLDA